MEYLLLVLGFVCLIKGADWLVEGAGSIAKKFHISELVIGLTIVSLGTSAPELIVNIISSFNDSSEIAIGNILGSNIANILLILGVSAIIRSLPIHKTTLTSEIPFSITATFLLGFLANASLYHGIKRLTISRLDGGILLFFFLLFMAYIFMLSKDGSAPGEDEEIEEIPMNKSILLIVVGMVGLFFGGKWVVDGAVFISRQLGMSETFIGLTVVAIGTSLPELVTSAMAAMKRNTDIAVGNVIGSNIFNILWILGISAVIKPLPFHVASNDDMLVLIFANTMLFFALIMGTKKNQIDRWNGVIFVMIYIMYLVFLTKRG